MLIFCVIICFFTVLSTTVGHAATAPLIIAGVIASVIALILAVLYIRRLTNPLQAVDKEIADVLINDLKFDESTVSGGSMENFHKVLEYVHRHIGELNNQIYRDSMTGVKSKNAYIQDIEQLDRRIDTEELSFGVIMADINHLKHINDTYGHEKGDELIKKGCAFLCRAFQHSPVYRFGGDEFVIILENGDFDNRDDILDRLQADIAAENESSDDELPISISIGMAVYDKSADKSFSDVFCRADELMYHDKAKIKNETDAAEMRR